MKDYHIPVLLGETIEGLDINPDGVYVDVTLGGGGHSEAVLEKLSKKGKLIGVDVDKDALKHCEKRFAGDERLTLIKGNFREINALIKAVEVEKIDGIIADFGVSSYQLDEVKRGFSYQDDKAYLDMRLNHKGRFDAKDVVNKTDARDLVRIFIEYGEVPPKFSKQIVKEIANFRKEKQYPIKYSGELKSIIKKVIKNPHYQTKIIMNVFRALRMKVNDELGCIKDFLPQAVELLKPGGRLCVITFHSIEDRIVKDHFKLIDQECVCPPQIPICTCKHKKLVNIINNKVIVPTEKELLKNLRSRSSKLRIVEKV